MPIPTQPDSPRRALVRDRVQEHLRQAILDGTLRPGERLRDDDLTEWLGSSRTPIREALCTLAQEGLIDMVPNRYTRVALPTPERALHAVRALGVLIGGIVRLTLPALTVTQREHAAARVSATIGQVRAGGTQAIVYTVDNGYQTWLELCPNPALVDVGRRTIQGLSFTYRVDNIDALVPCDDLITHLTAYRDGLLAGDPATASDAIEAAHLLPLSRPGTGTRP
jgi:DNA-binding GntR family transcriptional regulator